MQKLIARKSNRLKEYDYSTAGYYYVTVCSYDKKNIFGEIIDDKKSVGVDGCRPVNNNDVKIKLNKFGLIVEEELKKTENIRREIKLDNYVIMPNHLHCIIIIQRNLTGGQPSAPTGQTLSSCVSGFKSVVTKRINILRDAPAKPVWQRSFYDHVIRNEKSLQEIREYIVNNPVNWDIDENNIKNDKKVVQATCPESIKGSLNPTDKPRFCIKQNLPGGLIV